MDMFNAIPTPPLNVLVACEFSGVVRRAFRALGHNAWSCDLLPAEDGDCHHFIGDVLDIIEPGGLIEWDLMVAHPPCTYLCNSGVRWLWTTDAEGFNIEDDTRWSHMLAARDFFRAFLDCPHIPRIAIENPIPHRHAELPPYTQTIQPYEYGHPETKRTCLWLKGLPALKPTNIVEGREARVHMMPPGPDRWRERSRTFAGIAEAMAWQWGGDARQHSKGVSA